MAKINKGLANRFISIIVGISFFFVNPASAENSLRLPVGEKSTYHRMAETITRRSVVKGIGAAALLTAFSLVLSDTPPEEEYYMRLVEADPGKALIKFEEYKKQPFVSNVVKMAMKQLGGDRFIDEFHGYPKAFWEYMFSEVWRNTSEYGNREENKVSEILSNIADNPNQSQKKELLFFLAERYPDMFLVATRRYALPESAKWEDMEFIKKLYAKTAINHFIQDNNLSHVFFAGKRVISNGRWYIESIVSLDEANFTMDAVRSYGGTIGDILTRIVVLRYDFEKKEALSLISEIWDAFKTQGTLNDKEAFSLLRYLSLDFIKDINDYNEENELRFASVQNASPLQLYILMVYGEEELYTSSFNDVFNRFISKLQNEGTSLQEFFENQNYIKFRTLIKMSSWYDRLPDLLEGKGNSWDFKKNLLQRFIKGLEQEADPLSEAVAVAESFNYIEDDLILEILQQAVKSEHEKVEKNGDEKAKVIYGLLAGLFADNAVISKDWFKGMGERYKLPDLKVLSKNTLFDSNGVNTQRYFFYDDKDGVGSFKNFLKQYKNDFNWNVDEENAEYVRIVSRFGKKIEIYANRPEYADSGQKKIELLLEEKQQDALIVIHRGHSPYIGNTINKIDPNVVFVGLGSCGGYVNVKKVLEKSRKAHVLSTKGKGTAYINDPLLKMINELIRKDQDIAWGDLWAKAKQRFRTSPYFGQYVQPDKNLGVLFFQAYNDEIYKSESIDSGSLDSALMASLGAAAWVRVTDKENISRRNFLFGGFASDDSGKLASGQNIKPSKAAMIASKVKLLKLKLSEMSEDDIEDCLKSLMQGGGVNTELNKAISNKLIRLQKKRPETELMIQEKGLKLLMFKYELSAKDLRKAKDQHIQDLQKLRNQI